MDFELNNLSTGVVDVSKNIQGTYFIDKKNSNHIYQGVNSFFFERNGVAEKPHHFAGVLHSFTWDYLFSESIMLGGNQLDTLVELSSKNYASQIDDNFSDKLLRHKLKSLYQMLRYGGMDLTNIDAPEGPEMYKSIHNLPIWKNK